jgi:hypothetical protein
MNAENLSEAYYINNEIKNYNDRKAFGEWCRAWSNNPIYISG